MIDCSFYNPTKLIFGKQSHLAIPQEISKYGSRVLLLYGGGSIFKNGVYEKVTAVLQQAGIFFIEQGGVHANPLLSDVRKGMEVCLAHHIDFILAVGGGSVIDAAKAISIGMANEGDIWDYFVTKGFTVRSVVPVGCVLTIPAAGSESSIGTVITNDEAGHTKRALNNHIMIPKFAILNPEFTYSLPSYQTACGASDILAHLMERYFTRVDHVDFTDALLEASMHTLLSYAPLAILHPENYNIRAEIMLLGTVAHNNSLGIGRIGDWGSHDIQHETSAMFDVAHGAGLAVIFPAWMKYVSSDLSDRFVQFAVNVMHVPFSFGRKQDVIAEGIRRLESFYLSIGMPVRLGGLNIGEEHIEPLVQKTFMDRESIGNFKRLSADDVRAIYKLAL